MSLNLESLRKSIDGLARSIHAAHSLPDILSDDLKETIRAGVIQNFEVAYEQCWKMMQRWLKENINPEEAEFPRTRKELFRMAARYGLISDPLTWFVYSDTRNLSLDTYNEQQAVSVYKMAECFLPDAKYLSKQLEQSND